MSLAEVSHHQSRSSHQRRHWRAVARMPHRALDPDSPDAAPSRLPALPTSPSAISLTPGAYSGEGCTYRADRMGKGRVPTDIARWRESAAEQRRGRWGGEREGRLGFDDGSDGGRRG